MSLQKKILYLLIFIGAIFVFVAMSYLTLEDGRLTTMQKQERGIREHVFSRLIELKGESLKTLVTDYTYWDELVSFVATKDETWAQELLATSLPTYKADAIWVYNEKSEPIYVVQQSPENGLQAPAPAEAISKLFQSSPFTHFFVNTSQGLWEIRGGRIHSSDDQARTGAHYGYFFAGRHWSGSYLSELSVLSGGEIVLDPRQRPLPEPTVDNIVITHALVGWDDRPVARIQGTFDSAILKSSISTSQKVMILFLSYAIVACFLVSSFLFRWISQPLKAISRTLKDEDPRHLDNVKMRSGELYNVAEMIRRFFVQRQKLWETQAQLIQAERMSAIGQLASGVAHEINNPAGYIISNFESLQKYVQDLGVYIKGLEKLEAAARGSVDDYLKPALSELNVHRQHVDPGFILNDIVALVKESSEGTKRIKAVVSTLSTFAHREAAEKDYYDLNELMDVVFTLSTNTIRFKADLKRDYTEVPDVFCSKQEIVQVFLNLILNAMQAIGEERGVIGVKSFVEKDMVCMQVSDTGEGIKPELLTKIFEPFFTTKPRSSGLGLSLAYNLVENHQGSITATSEVGKGSVFTVKLPIGK